MLVTSRYTTSNNKVCDNNNCKDMNMYQISILTGQELCFKDSEGETLRIKIVELYELSRFNLMYYTSNYTVKHESHYECSGNGECNNDNPVCQIGYRHTDYKDKVDTINGYSCENTVATCDTYCWRAGACTYYHWYVERVGNLYTVYNRIGKIWETVLSINYKGVIKLIKLNTNNPTNNILGELLEGYNKVPLMITNFMTETVYISNSLTIISNKGYLVSASEPNMPIKGMIGDYQISTNKESYTMDESSVLCRVVDHCKANCVIKKPSIARYIEEDGSKRKVEIISKRNNNYFVDVKNKVQGTLTMMLGNIVLNNLHIETAKCEIDVTMTYGCTACTDKPYIVFSSYNIKNEGILPFESNCSFERYYLSCNIEPYILKLSDNNNHCLIHVPLLNKTLVVSIEYKYLGKLSPDKYIYSQETTSEAIKNIVTSEQFINTFMNTAMTLTLMSTSITVIYRLSRFLIVKKTINDIENKT